MCATTRSPLWMLDPCPSLTSATKTPVVGQRSRFRGRSHTDCEAAPAVKCCMCRTALDMTSPLLSSMTSRSPAPPFRTFSTLAAAHGARHAIHAVPEIRAAAKCSDVCTSARREGSGRTLASQCTPAAADGLALQAEARWEQSMRLAGAEQDDITRTDCCLQRHPPTVSKQTAQTRQRGYDRTT